MGRSNDFWGVDSYTEIGEDIDVFYYKICVVF